MYKDITSYNRGDIEKTPRVLQNEANEIVFRVHKHIYYGNQWLLSCDELNVDKIPLNTDNMEIAKEKGRLKMIELLNRKAEEYKKAADSLL